MNMTPSRSGSESRDTVLILAALCSLVLVGDGISTPVAGSSPTLVVPSSEETLQIAVPLPAAIKPATAASWRLVEMGPGKAAVPVQLVSAMADDGSADEGHRRVVATIPPAKTVAPVRRFLLQTASSGVQQKVGFAIRDADKNSVKLVDGDRPVLVYNHGVITNANVPKDNPERSRACYVHPVWGINGEVLTDDFPKDHYHHHGIFWAWPHVGIAGKHYDIWMYHDIHDQFVRWICRDCGPTAAVLAVENGWFVGAKKVMVERVWLRSYAVSDDARALDLDFVWIPVDNPITLRSSDNGYGGLAMRFAVPEGKHGTITTPAGLAKEDLSNVRLPWADMTYSFAAGDARSGAAIFVAPDHRDYPPGWLLRHYGPLTVGWPGASEKTFPPGVPIRLKYRVWIHKSAGEVGWLQRAYDAYVAAGKARWE
jgi:hypothetical protein